MAENRKLKVFLCHSKEDKYKVRELYHKLIVDGFDPWFDEERLMPGQDWDLEIRKAVHETDIVLVCLSKKSLTKAGYVQKEIRFALDVAEEQPEDGIFIIPAKLEDCEVPSRLSKWQWVDLSDKYGYKRLKTTLIHKGALLGYTIEEDSSIRVEVAYRRVWIGEKAIRLPVTSFQLFMLLYEKSPNPITYEEILYHVKKFPIQKDTVLNREWIRVNITRLRKSLGNDSYIQSERDVGYRLLLRLEDN